MQWKENGLSVKFENKIFQVFVLLVHKPLISIFKNIKYFYKI